MPEPAGLTHKILDNYWRSTRARMHIWDYVQYSHGSIDLGCNAPEPAPLVHATRLAAKSRSLSPLRLNKLRGIQEHFLKNVGRLLNDRSSRLLAKTNPEKCMRSSIRIQ